MILLVNYVDLWFDAHLGVILDYFVGRSIVFAITFSFILKVTHLSLMLHLSWTQDWINCLQHTLSRWFLKASGMNPLLPANSWLFFCWFALLDVLDLWCFIFFLIIIIDTGFKRLIKLHLFLILVFLFARRAEILLGRGAVGACIQFSISCNIILPLLKVLVEV